MARAENSAYLLADRPEIELQHKSQIGLTKCPLPSLLKPVKKSGGSSSFDSSDIVVPKASDLYDVHGGSIYVFQISDSDFVLLQREASSAHL